MNEIKNLLKFIASKYTDKQEEYEEIEKLVKMDGGMIENTVKQMQRIYREEGIQLERQNSQKEIERIKRELKERGIEEELIEEVIKKAEREIK